jgi:transcriptional regulator with XRE-family HTH domain
MVIGDFVNKRIFLRATSKSAPDFCGATFPRVENGHTVPAVATLEKMARALEVPLYKLFYDGEKPAQAPKHFSANSPDKIAWGSSGKDAKFLNKLRRLMGKAKEEDRELILYTLQKMAR